MSGSIPRWQQRFEHFVSSLGTMEKVLPGFSEMSELEQDGLIQRFSVTFDLSWKVMQDYIAFAGYNGIKGPRASITQMAQIGLLDAFIWEALLNARNELSHIYDQGLSRVHLSGIISDFVPALQAFKTTMTAKI